MGGGEVLWCSPILQLLDGQPTNRRILHRGVSLVTPSAAPRGRLSSLGAWRSEEEPRSSGLRRPAGPSEGLQGLGERRLQSGECPRGFTGTGLQAKQWLRRNPAPHLWLWRVSWGGRVSCCSRRGGDASGRGSREYSSAWALSEATVWAQSSEPAREPAASSAAVPRARQPAERGRRPPLCRRPSGVLPSAALPRTHCRGRGRAHRGSRLAPPRVGRRQPPPPGSCQSPRPAWPTEADPRARAARLQPWKRRPQAQGVGAR